MAARQLQYALAAESVLQRLLADGTLAANKGTLAAGARPFNVEHAGHASAGPRGELGVEGRVAPGEGLRVEARLVKLGMRAARAGAIAS